MSGGVGIVAVWVLAVIAWAHLGKRKHDRLMRAERREYFRRMDDEAVYQVMPNPDMEVSDAAWRGDLNDEERG